VALLTVGVGLDSSISATASVRFSPRRERRFLRDLNHKPSRDFSAVYDRWS
jgi:hypothetical protein